jgi:hypothetical protein
VKANFILTYYGVTMDNQTEQPQAETPKTSGDLVVVTDSRELFSSSFKSFDINPDKLDGLNWNDKELMDLISRLSEEGQGDPEKCVDLMSIEDNPYVEKLKEIIYTICQDLPEFNTELQYTPVIIGSNALFQQPFEHIPLHCYEHVPLVFTLIMHGGEYIPPTYFADTRGGAHVIRHFVAQNLVGASFMIKGRVGEIFVSPGHMLRYSETNLDKTQTYVTLNIKIGFGR